MNLVTFSEFKKFPTRVQRTKESNVKKERKKKFILSIWCCKRGNFTYVTTKNEISIPTLSGGDDYLWSRRVVTFSSRYGQSSVKGKGEKRQEPLVIR